MYLGFSLTFWIYIRFITQYLYVLTVNAEKLFVLVEQTVVVVGIIVKPEKNLFIKLSQSEIKTSFYDAFF